LKKELEERDAQLATLREEQEIASQLGGAALTPTSNVEQLEEQVQSLREELLQRSMSVPETDNNADWTFAAKDPYDHASSDDLDLMPDTFMADYTPIMDDDAFSDAPTEVLESTPAPAVRNSYTSASTNIFEDSFPSPPATEPNTPKTPRQYRKPLSPIHIDTRSASYTPDVETADCGVQASLPDPRKGKLKQQLNDLRLELNKLSAALETAETANARLADKLAPYVAPVLGEAAADVDPQDALDFALDSVLTHLALAQEEAQEAPQRFAALCRAVESVFPLPRLGDDDAVNAHAALNALAKQFHQARVELERAMPGEQTEGFDNVALLGMLTGRLTGLVQQVKRQEADIDQYHEQELSLRVQLGARVDAMEALKAQLHASEAQIATLHSEALEKDSSATKLRHALDKYRSDVATLESLISRMESEHATAIQALNSNYEATLHSAATQVQHDVRHRALREQHVKRQDALIEDLEAQLRSSRENARLLQAELDALTAACHGQANEIVELKATVENQKMTAAARLQRQLHVGMLREEVARLTAALAAAQTEVEAAKRRVEEERERRREAVKTVKGELKRALDTVADVNTPVKKRRATLVTVDFGRATAAQSQVTQAAQQAKQVSFAEAMDVDPSTSTEIARHPVVRTGGLFDTSRARRSGSFGPGCEEGPSRKKARMSGGAFGEDAGLGRELGYVAEADDEDGADEPVMSFAVGQAL
jgi:archaellum component FlaC